MISINIKVSVSKTNESMTEIQMKPPPIRNMGAGSIQLTADQILKDAEIHRQITITPPAQVIKDQKQLVVYTQQKRREFEDKLRRQRYNLSVWVRYAQWQQNLKEFTRARSVFERALEIDYGNKSLWLKYAEMQMKNKFINHARNVWERATHYLPRQDQFWFKYSYMEQVIGQYAKARNIFERWMDWVPGEKGWMSFIKFEERMGQTTKAKQILYRYLQAFPSLNTYLKVAKAEVKSRNKSAARNIYQRIIIQLGSEALEESYFSQFAKFEIKSKQYDRARQIFKFGLKHIPKEKAKNLYENYLNFEKEYGTKDEIDVVILGERRNIYKDLIAKNQLNYDAWLNLLFLQESFKDIQKIREVYEAAIKVKPPMQEKRFWRRYIYIWYNYAIFEQEIAQDIQKAQNIYQRIIKLIPHKKFTFGKVWINFAHFYLRCGQLIKARKIFGRAIGIFPKQKVFKAYIKMQEQLCQLDRVRTIYQKYCQKFANFPQPWIDFAYFEANLQEQGRAREILKIGQQLGIQGIPDHDEFIRNFQEQQQNQEVQ